MMRSLWTAATGMLSQQTSLDTIANNLSNVNTTGYKKETVEFKSLLYQTLQNKSTDNEGNPKPIGVQVGLGVRTASISSQFTQGNLNQTGNDFDLALDGNGFFVVQTESGETAYTRNGNFVMAMGIGGLTLSTTTGNPVLDTTGKQVAVDATKYSASKITIDETGNLCYPDEKGIAQPMNIQIAIAQCPNPAGMTKGSNSLLYASETSGAPSLESNNTNLKKSRVLQGYLEASNVQAVDEMVNMIVAQRAYEMNSKIITSSDEMLRTANNLRQ